MKKMNRCKIVKTYQCCNGSELNCRYFVGAKQYGTLLCIYEGVDYICTNKRAQKEARLKEQNKKTSKTIQKISADAKRILGEKHDTNL